MTEPMINKLLNWCCIFCCALLAVVCIELVWQPFSSESFAQQDQFPGEKIVHLLQEPRHRTVNEQDGLYVLDVQVNPGDESLPHTHDQAILVTMISRGNGLSDSPVSSNTDYATTPVTHKISNDGPGLLRIIAFVNGGLAVSGTNQDRPTGMAGEPQLENPWFRSYTVELDAGEQTSIQTHINPSVIIQRTEGLVHVTREDGVVAELDAPADWAWRNANSSYIVRNMGQVAVAVTINEGRQ
jgi:hypothetical protein